MFYSADRPLGAFVCAGLLVFFGWESASGQPTAIDPLAAASPVQNLAAPNRVFQAPETALAADDFSGGTQRSFSGPSQTRASKKSYWEAVPPIQSFPRQGNFFIAPSGPGSYTFVDLLRGRQLSDRPMNPYLQWGQNANSFFNADFRYLENPNNTGSDFFDPIKRIHIGDNWLFSTGGEIRDRYADIQNAALYNKKPGAGAYDAFNLFRARVYGDLWYQDLFRLYGEVITADSSGQSIPLGATDVARFDILNLFTDVNLFSIGSEGVYLRFGRQEMMFGSQRAISPSDWGNARRAFDGVRILYHGDKVEENLFAVRPVIVDPNDISSDDRKQLFAGNWFKYRFTRDISLDLYYLYLNNNTQVSSGQYKAKGGFDVNSLGTRFVGDYQQFLWDFEGVYQAGHWVNQAVSAGILVGGLGYHFKNLPTSPTIWVYYDYASGDPNPGDSNLHQTYATLYPFGHSYFNGSDALGRQNLRDFHLEAGMFLTKWLRLTAGYHLLTLDQAKDALYSSTGAVVRQDITGKSGKDVGTGLNGNLQFHIDNHQVLLLSYSRIVAGSYLKNTATTPGAAKDLSAFWMQYAYKW